MMNSGPSGFNNAPITRAFVVACCLFTILFGIQDRSNKLGSSYQDIGKKLQLWKLIVSVFAFSSTSELMFGAYLLYYFRVFERQIGSNKYAVFVSFSIIVSSLLQYLAQAFVNDPALSVRTSGPYGLIFSSFVPFFFDIPVSTQFRVSSLSVPDKSFIYIAGLQLLFSSWRRSLIPGLCGILAGFLYRLNILRIRKLKFPNWIASFFSMLSLPSVGGGSPAPPPRNAPSFAARHVQGNYGGPMPSAPEPSEDHIATLVSMGFDRNSARQALVHARNDINVATNILLNAESH